MPIDEDDDDGDDDDVGGSVMVVGDPPGRTGFGGSVRATLDFGLGDRLTAREFKPPIRLCADSVEPAWGSPLSLSFSLSLSLSAPPPPKINK